MKVTPKKIRLNASQDSTSRRYKRRDLLVDISDPQRSHRGQLDDIGSLRDIALQVADRLKLLGLQAASHRFPDPIDKSPVLVAEDLSYSLIAVGQSKCQPPVVGGRYKDA